MKKVLLSLILFLLFLNTSYAQQDNSFFHNRKYTSYKSDNNLYLEIKNINFFKNNEYFSPFAEGYTNIGFHLSPSLSYYIADKGKITAGMYVLQFSGRKESEKILPIFSFQYNINPKLKLTFGSLDGSINHNLISPIFDFEKLITNNIENGIQFLYTSDNTKIDLWLDWQQFIKRGDPFQEYFTVGYSSTVNLYKSNDESLHITLPIQCIFNHHGGQIDTSGKRILTINNDATGLIIDKKFDASFLKEIKTGFYFLLYKDLSPTKVQGYEQGKGFYPFIVANIKEIELTTGYWYGHKFYSPLGHPLFQNISIFDKNTFVTNKKMLTSTVTYTKKIFQNINLASRFEGFYDITTNKFDYTYSLYLTFNSRFFLCKKPFQ